MCLRSLFSPALFCFIWGTFKTNSMINMTLNMVIPWTQLKIYTYWYIPSLLLSAEIKMITTWVKSRQRCYPCIIVQYQTILVQIRTFFFVYLTFLSKLFWIKEGLQRSCCNPWWSQKNITLPPDHHHRRQFGDIGLCYTWVWKNED